MEIQIFQNTRDNYLTSRFIDSIRFIPLETTSSNIIGNITKIIKTEDKYFILDSNSSKRIFVFDHNGKFLYSIGDPGKGPGELSRPVDFSIDVISNTLLILDENKIVKVGINGNFIIEKRLPQEARSFSNIVAHDGMIYAFSGQQLGNEKKFQLVQFNENLEPDQWIFPFQDYFPGSIIFNNALYTFNGKANFVSVFDNALYQKTGDGFKKRYVFNFNGKELVLKNLSSEQFISDNTKAYLFYNCVEGDNVIFLPVFDEGRPKYGFLLKDTNKFLLIQNIEEDSQVFIPPFSFYKGKFISAIGCDIFRNLFPDSSIDPGITDNPILVEYTIDFKDEK